MAKKWIFLSHFYDSGTPGYGGKADFIQEHTRCTSHGDKCNQFKFTMSNHVGTHIDLPFHFCQNGRKLDSYSAEDWIFNNVEVVEIDVEKHELLTSDKLPKLKSSTEALIIKTNFEKYRSSEDYWNSNPGLTGELGDFLKSHYKHIKLIGFDFISATAFTHKAEGAIAHLSFLGNENGSPILIVEDMKLNSIGNHFIEQMHIAPLLIKDADGVPVTITALLKVENHE